MTMLTEEMLCVVNGGDKASEDAGYAIGRAVKQAWNAVSSAASNAWNSVKTWWNGLW